MADERLNSRPTCSQCGEPLEIRHCDACEGKGYTRVLAFFKAKCANCSGRGTISVCPKCVAVARMTAQKTARRQLFPSYLRLIQAVRDYQAGPHYDPRSAKNAAGGSGSRVVPPPWHPSYPNPWHTMHPRNPNNPNNPFRRR